MVGYLLPMQGVVWFQSLAEELRFHTLCSAVWQWASLVAQLVKNLLVMRETWVRPLGWEDPVKKGKATHSSILAWRIPRNVVCGVAESNRSERNLHFFRPL